MAIIERWKPNREIDPKYPYYCRRNEAGKIVYSVPLEAPNDIPVDKDADNADKVEYSYLPLPGGKNLRVYCWETTDREWAFRVRRMINTQHAAERRYAKRSFVVPEVYGDGRDDGNRKVCCTSGEMGFRAEEPSGEGQEAAVPVCGLRNGYEQHVSPDVEKRVLDRMEIEDILALVERGNSRCWQVFYRIRLLGDEAKAVAGEMGLCVQRVYQLAAKFTEITREYRKENP